MKFTGEKLCSWRNLIPAIFVIFGIVFMIQCNINSIYEFNSHNDHNLHSGHGKDSSNDSSHSISDSQGEHH